MSQETSAREEPSNRLHQSRMSCLLDETHIIQYHMDKQEKLITRLSDCLPAWSSKVETASLRNRFHVELIREYLTDIQLQLDSLLELRRMTRELSETVSNGSYIIF